MGLKDGLLKWYMARRLRTWREDGMLGKLSGGAKALWDLVNGWKSVILTVVLTAQLWCKTQGCDGPLGAVMEYVDPALKAMGWSAADAAVAPAAMLASVLTLFTFSHALLKAYQDYRAGVPLKNLRSIPVEAVDVKALQAKG